MLNNKEIAIEVKDIHKEFILPQSKNSTFKQTVVNIVKRNKKVTQKVLDGVSFNVEEGDFFGIVGRNGSGKSTLLKLIAGVYAPTAGNINVNGGLTPFIELGVGFNPELSGRDNVYLNGALLGFNRKQMSRMYEEIVAFAEIEPFMDQKLKNYSSGMQVRLAFSIAIKAKNDILLFDEVLAVGDSNFQEKCIRQFKKFKKEKRTIVLVTHSMDTVEKFCNKVILLSNGKVEYEGDSAGAIDKYNTLNMETINQSLTKKSGEVVEISKVDILNSNGEIDRTLKPHEDFSIKINIKAKESIKDAFLAVRICESENQFPIIGFDNEQDKKDIDLSKGENNIEISIKTNPLIGGKYYVVLGLYDSSKRIINYYHYNGMLKNNLFMINKSIKGPGLVDTKRGWG